MVKSTSEKVALSDNEKAVLLQMVIPFLKMKRGTENELEIENDLFREITGSQDFLTWMKAKRKRTVAKSLGLESHEKVSLLKMIHDELGIIGLKENYRHDLSCLFETLKKGRSPLAGTDPIKHKSAGL